MEFARSQKSECALVKNGLGMDLMDSIDGGSVRGHDSAVHSKGFAGFAWPRRQANA